jgi:integrase
LSAIVGKGGVGKRVGFGGGFVWAEGETFVGKLTALDVTRLPSGVHLDGDGLYLQVSGAGGRSWIWRYALQGKTRYLGLGSASAIPLKRARELAAEARRLRAEGIDPIERRREQRSVKLVEQAKSITFEQCAEAYIVAHEPSWRNAKHRAQWRSTLSTYVYPIIGALPVQSVDTALVTRIIEPIWAKKSETAGRVRGRIELILDYATARKYRQGDNPARWRGHLDKLLPKRSKVSKVVHHAALPYLELGAFMAELRRRESTSARCLEFTILTAARTSEAIGAEWDEIDLSTKVWTVPAERMKSGREHRVPLSSRALEIIRERQARREGDYLFAGMRGGNPLSNMALLAMLRVMGRADLTTHGFRATFKTWATERSNFPREVVEAALAHIVGDETERAYQRGDLFEKRRRLMDAWSEFCGKSVRISNNKIVDMNSRVSL